MKISYKVLKKYIKDIKPVEDVAKDLVMHTAEVEEIMLEAENLEKVFVWEVLTCEKHSDSEKLNCTTVKVGEKVFPIVCWAKNVRAWLKVAVATVWAELTPDFRISKTKIRWEVSEWMICSEDELWLVDIRQEWILELPNDAIVGMCMRDYLNKNDAILEIDNKAINHRPDLFSHVWIIREIYTINNTKFDFEYENRDFSNLETLWIKNDIEEVVKRYMWLKIKNVSNIDSPEYIKQVLTACSANSKWLLVDLTNYSLYFYWQPTHIFDADKIEWDITIRYAKIWEKFIALDDKEYNLNWEDIVISDNKKIIALAWIIWAKSSAVSDDTKNIIIEAAHFDQAILRKTWKKLGIRTDALNVFEKDIVLEMPSRWLSLIVSELEKNLDNIEITNFSDIYNYKQEEVSINFDLDFINNLIGKKYSREEALNILSNLWIKEENNILTIPFFRKDLNFKSDIAEEIARIDGYDNIESTIPRINLWAIIQSNIYKIKNDVRNYFTNNGWFDMYTYSFVNKELMEKCLGNTFDLVPMKNALTEELTHLRWSLVPNLLLSLEKNIKDFKDMKLFELEKVFLKSDLNILEYYSLAGVCLSKKDLVYYDIQNIVSNLFQNLWINRYMFDLEKEYPSFSHKWRTSSIILRWKKVWTIWEIHPKVAKNFDIEDRIWYFEINIKELEDAVYSITNAKEISNFQENNFDLNFVVNKNIKARDIKVAIEKTNPNLITKVDLFDIYEDEEKLPWKRSLVFKIFINSMTTTLDDKVKNELINEIIKKVEKKWWELR